MPERVARDLPGQLGLSDRLLHGLLYEGFVNVVSSLLEEAKQSQPITARSKCAHLTLEAIKRIAANLHGDGAYQ